MEIQGNDEAVIRALYQQLLAAWNERSAARMATLFTTDANVTGFDGSQMNGSAEIETTTGKIFVDHQTAKYVGIVREVRFLAPSVALLRAVAGMVSPGQSTINPAVNTIQSLVAVKQASKWAIALYQNTPAQFHGRPDLVQQLTEELQRML